jgi:hypothetical protein
LKEENMSVTIEVRDYRGASVTATVDLLTRFIFVDVQDVEEFYLNPDDPKAVEWLKKVFGDKVNYII